MPVARSAAVSLVVLVAAVADAVVWSHGRFPLPAPLLPQVASPARIGIVETLPIGSFDLAPLPGSKSTAEGLAALFDAATETIDILAMYWNLEGVDDHKIYSDDELQAFGARHGHAVYAALRHAVERNVSVRVVGSKSDQFQPTEIESFVPNIRLWDAVHWYGGGIMHQKMVLVDKQHAYLGSANMDWKSLAQVMEVGVVLEAAPAIVDDMQRLFELWWAWSDPALVARYAPIDVFSDKFQVTLRLPPWSDDVPEASRVPSPFTDASMSSIFNKVHNLHTLLNNKPAGVFLSASPDSATSGARTRDEDALVYTLQSAKTAVSLSVMDFLPFATYPIATHASGSIHWPALTDAILSVVLARNVSVRLLVSHWAHSRPVMVTALRQLQAQADLHHKRGLGRVEIRLFEVPGYNETVPAPGRFPPFSRVNHAKFIVSDSRVNIGTSNMEWGYFYNTAGASFNTNHPDAIAAVQAIFDRNWASAYARPLA
ncbi:hypothetical protein SPRG_08520 [Saprolegnia parasitica CBS 223.65]|uniref:PLD phosphodiesterase domain-containing protein n=1 Tax=Saprolegnia parasitica (strain CBS 223.65) TaxID=695850 RepID=A0A067C5X6_SAPPC|nr:hypothetical protein SPRG_08520 [Saprolegnia parasitica CBS 223.65]KDO26159.1 hypothetical protein SPRG_08520 [Saprolegnia parasitica CBS 223.65]|eukprot:XP_012203153.1 hypothetical protein SPRG_08520 [Saprolegnia parasitica CBS 223.65]